MVSDPPFCSGYNILHMSRNPSHLNLLFDECLLSRLRTRRLNRYTNSSSPDCICGNSDSACELSIFSENVDVDH